MVSGSSTATGDDYQRHGHNCRNRQPDDRGHDGDLNRFSRRRRRQWHEQRN